MPTSLPQSVRESRRLSGEEVATDFAAWLDPVEERFDRTDERRDRMGDRLNQMDEKLDRMNDRILSMTRWLIGLIALYGTAVTGLLAVAQFGR